MRQELREAIEALHLIAGGNSNEIERPLHEIVNNGLKAIMRDGVSPDELAESIWDVEALRALQS